MEQQSDEARSRPVRRLARLTGSMTMSPCSLISAWISLNASDLSTASRDIGFSGRDGEPRINLTVTRWGGKSGMMTRR